MAIAFPRMARIEKFDDPATLPGMVVSAQIFRSFTDSRSRVQALVSEGVRRPEGDLSPVPFPDTRPAEGLFRRLLPTRAHQAGWLSAEFLFSLLSWRRSGFSIPSTSSTP